jgi:hypothetical protein
MLEDNTGEINADGKKRKKEERKADIATANLAARCQEARTDQGPECESGIADVTACNDSRGNRWLVDSTRVGAAF